LNLRDPPAWLLPAAAVGVVGLGLAIAPGVYHHYDVVDCFLAWSRASFGTRPWRIYLTTFPDDCDYPPVVPYLLTLTEAVRRMVRAPEVGAVAVTALKLPNLLALPALAWLCRHELAGIFGSRHAAWAAVLAAASLPSFVNAAAWGQYDVLLSALVAAGLVALLRGRPSWAGVAFGAALATKLLAVVAVPAAAVWTWRRYGARALLSGVACAAATCAALAAPYAVAGAGPQVARAYLGAVDYYPVRSAEAYNGWYLLDRYDVAVRGLPAREAKADTRAALGPLTFRDLGLGALTLYLLSLLALLWRRPTAYALVLATAMSFFGFFMLPTQVHQRYILPAAVVLGLVATTSRHALVLFAGLTLTATLNQALDLTRAVLDHGLTTGAVAWAPAVYRGPLRVAATVVAVVNLVLFAWATWRYPRALREAPA
jgi:hypothetical protein